LSEPLDWVFWKSVGASVAFALAVLNLLIMLQLYRKIRLFPGQAAFLARWHRRQGDVILVLFVSIAYNCVTRGYVDPAQPRVLAHATLGGLTLATITFKFVTVNWIPRLMDHIAVIGATLFTLTTGTVFTSALWYFLTWIREGARPVY